MASLKQQTLSGFFWSFLQNVGGQGINFVVMIILARLLSPDAFGLIGMLMIFIQVSQMLVIAGFNQALIQKQDADEEDFSSVFWINLAVSIVIYCLLFFTSPLIARFYDQSILIQLTRALALVFVINAFSYVQETRLTKEMEFKKLTYIQLPSTIIGAVTSILMAVKGFGVWSIVGLQLITRFAYAIQIWIYAKWRPLFAFNRRKVKILFAYGGNLMVSQLISTVFKNIYVVVIGKFFPLSSTGYYQNANNLVQYPASTISRAFQSVIFPAFSTVQGNNTKLKMGHKKLVEQTAWGITPIFVFAAILAHPLFQLIFTDKWLPAVPYFQMLCIVGIFWPINIYGLNVINVKGKSAITLRLEILKKILIAFGILLVLIYKLGVEGIIIVQIINSLSGYVLNSYYAGKLIKYSLVSQIVDVLPVFLTAIISGIFVYLIKVKLIGSGLVLCVIVCILIGVIIYLILSRILNLDAYSDFKEILKKSLKLSGN